MLELLEDCYYFYLHIFLEIDVPFKFLAVGFDFRPLKEMVTEPQR